MTQQSETASKKPKQKRNDAYVARLSVSIPIDASNPESFSDAVKAVDAMTKSLPEGAKVTFASRGMAKI